MDPKTKVDEILDPFRPLLGGDYERYRNHAQRVLLNCLLLDRNEEHVTKYAVAAAFHDIGIWTGHTFDYLWPSILQASNYLEQIGRQDWVDEITQMIYWHHKMTPYKATHFSTVDCFRKADWIDVSLGVLSFSANRALIRKYRKELPNHGFHWFLLKQTFHHVVRHPMHPLPMFKR
jgi:hypothetical protein